MGGITFPLIPRGDYMSEFELAYDKDRKRLYLKEEVAKVFGFEPTQIRCLVNAETVLLYKDDADYEHILKSLEILRLDVELRRSKQQADNVKKEG